MSGTIGRAVNALRRRASPDWWRARRYARARTRAFVGPYPLDAYAGLLRRVKADARNRFLPFSENAVPPDCCGWYVRHDIDTPDCPAAMPAVLALDAEAGVRSGSYIRMNCASYRVQDLVTDVRHWREQGFFFGLHSECYMQPDWQATLKAEISGFEQVFGFKPNGLNAHGYGSFRRQERDAFYAGVSRIGLTRLGLTFSDLHDELRRYEYIVDDSRSFEAGHGLEDYRPERRYLLSDVLEPPPPIVGARMLFLSHPGYWRDAA